MTLREFIKAQKGEQFREMNENEPPPIGVSFMELRMQKWKECEISLFHRDVIRFFDTYMVTTLPMDVTINTNTPLDELKADIKKYLDYEVFEIIGRAVADGKKYISVVCKDW